MLKCFCIYRLKCSKAISGWVWMVGWMDGWVWKSLKAPLLRALLCGANQDSWRVLRSWTLIFLDVIASPSTYPCQWVSEWFIVSYLEIAIASPSFASLFRLLPPIHNYDKWLGLRICLLPESNKMCGCCCFSFSRPERRKVKTQNQKIWAKKYQKPDLSSSWFENSVTLG